MSIQNEIDRVKGNVAGAYSAVGEKGGTVPEEAISANLAEAIRSIPAGGNGSTTYLVNAPIGAIVAWSGTKNDVPQGWHICDGEDGTIDLRDKFILGAGTAHNVGEAGGSETVTLTVEQMPRHTHAIDSRRSSSINTGSSVNTYLQASSNTGTYDTSTLTFVGSNAPHSNMPPYYTLLFIQKISASQSDYVTEEQVDEKIEEALGNASEGTVDWEDINGRPDLSSVAKLTNIEITLYASSWNETDEQTAVIPDILDDETKQLISPIPSSASFDAYYHADIRAVRQAEGSLTFKCFSDLPDDDLTVYVYIQETTEPKKDYVKFVWWSPKMTSDNTPAPYVASASSILSSGAPAWYAFDGVIDTNNTNYWHSASNDEHPWISFCFGKKTRVRGLQIIARVYRGNAIMPSHGIVEGSNDGYNWTEITSFSEWERVDDGRAEEILFDNPTEYSYYRIADMDSGYVGFSEIKFYRLESEVLG